MNALLPRNIWQLIFAGIVVSAAYDFVAEPFLRKYFTKGTTS